jgi:uncharacterized protein
MRQATPRSSTDRFVQRLAGIEATLRASPIVRPVLERWDEIALPDCWIVAGALFQTFWNAAYDLPPTYGIRDVDLIYFDDTDLSKEAEAAHAARINALFAGASVCFDVKNEARVHLWYTQKFGYPIRPYASSRDAIATFPTTPGAVGVRPNVSGLEWCAPFGLEDLLGLIVRPNKVQITAEIYATKVTRWKTLWPRLTIVDWSDNQPLTAL